MRYKFITVPAWDPAAGEAELSGFLASHRIMTVEKQWLASEHNPAWHFVINGRLGKAQRAQHIPALCRVLAGGGG